MLNPFGGYKGSGLALMFECLSSLIVGVPLLAPNLLGFEDAPRRGTQNGVLAAIDIGTFTDVERYKENVDQLAKGIKALARADGFDAVLLPGEPEEQVREQRLREGIPLPGTVVQSLQEVAAELGVKTPAELS